jgi:DNA mismatch repair protein MutL
MSEESGTGGIRQLDPTTVERIAAGEVVERPASVVKELVENSLDADASRIAVTVESGGKDAIRVTDDGTGMSQAAVEKAVEKHTTSKIRDSSDLEQGVATLGFRGEALHAIGAVSRLTIRTRPRGADRGTELVLEGGEVQAVDPVGCPEGTTIEVENLFYNVPARRKYLKQDGTEFAHVNRVVTNYALANPDVRISLTHDERENFATTGQDDLQETVMSVYGREVAEAMLPVDSDDMPDGPLDDVHGVVSHPETNRSGREYVSTFVNGRYVTSGTVREAIVEAYGKQLAADRYPFAVLFLEIPGGEVDVNVHPRKRELRFADESGVHEQVRTAVHHALLSNGLVRTSAPRGQSAPAQAQITPGEGRSESDPDPERDASTTDSTADVEDASSSTDAGSTADSGTRDAPSTDDSHRSTSETTADLTPIHDSTSTESSGSTAESGERADPSSESSPEPDAASDDGVDTEGTDSAATDSDASPVSQMDDDRADTAAARKFSDSGTQVRFGTEDGAPETEFDSLPSLRILGQLDETYVVAESDAGLVLIDQHAADERVNYERLRAQLSETTTTQVLAEPIELELTAGESALYEDFSEALAQLGFHAQRTGGRTVEITTVPAAVAETGGPELLRDALSAFAADDANAAATVDAVADALIADLACYPSLTGNTSLTDGTIVDLLTELDECENPYACPHGRPVVIELDRAEIESRFERDYPGHGHRRQD